MENNLSTYENVEILEALTLAGFSTYSLRHSLAELWASGAKEQFREKLLSYSGKLHAGNLKMARLERERIAALGGGVIALGSAAYPEVLMRLYDPPLVLYVLSRNPCWHNWLSEQRQRLVAVVGARDCSAYGMRVAEAMGSWAARAGIGVVSGLARGIDTAVHRGVLRAAVADRGVPIGVVAGGLSHISPMASRPLAENLLSAGGMLLSEYGVGMQPTQHYFRERNRIVAALSALVVIVEARERSGALITARIAGEIGIDIGAVPGQITSPVSAGCHKLICDGAALIDSEETFLRLLNYSFGETLLPEVHKTLHWASTELLGLNSLAVKLVSLLQGGGALSLDEMIKHLGVERTVLYPTLGELEAKGIIERQFDGRYTSGDQMAPN